MTFHSRPLDQQTIVITGASSGIGEATALAFAVKGSRLVLAARDLEAVQAVADRCADAGGQALAVQVDVVDAASVSARRRRC